MPILFDIDDTLLDDRGAQDVYLGALYSTHRERLPHDEAAFRAAWRRAIAAHFPRYLRGEISLREQQRSRVRDVFAESTMSSSHADAIVDEFLHEYECAWRVFPDTLATLDALRDSALAVVSNGSTEQQLRKLRHVGIFDRFRVIAISESVGHAKPAAEIFRHVCVALKCEPRECVHIGDDWEKDVEGALAAGIPAIWLNREALTAPRANGGVRTVSALTEALACPELVAAR